MKLLRLFASALVLACALSVQARSAADFFLDAPADIVPLINRNAKLDMLDYFRHQLPTPTPNMLGGRSRITAESPAAIDIQLTRDASLQLAVIPVKKDTVIAVIETVLTPVADSSIKFYRTDWTPLKKQPAMPGLADFVVKDKTKEARHAQMPDALFVRASYDAATGLFNFVNTTVGNYTEHDRPAGLALLRSSVVMRYNGGAFVEVNDNER